MKISLESELILAIAREVVCSQRNKVMPLIKEDNNIDWPKLKEGLTYHGLFCFAYLSLRDSPFLLPERLVNALRATYYYYLKFSFYLEREFLNLFGVFEEKGIALVPIKGVALLEDLYAEYPVRPSADIDVLVREEDLDQAAVILEELGFKKELGGLKESYWRQKQYHLIFVKRNKEGFSLIVELHYGLDYRRNKKLLPDIFGRLREFPMQNRRVKLLSVEDTFFALALHQRRFGKALALRDVCDIARLLNKYTLTFDWEYVLTEAGNSQICATVFFVLCQANFLLGADIPQHVWEGLKIPAWKKRIIRRFIEKNTFLEGQNAQSKNLYLKEHFLLYDTFWEPIDYIWKIPQEQFAKFYGLKPYDKKTDFFYRNRLLYIPSKAVFNLISRLF